MSIVRRAAAGVVRVGRVATFDDVAGWGSLESEGEGEIWFHCTSILDGSRRIEPGRIVAYTLAPGPRGHLEAVSLHKLEPSQPS